MKKNFNNDRGFIKMILLIVAGLVLLKYIYNIDVVGFLTKGKSRELLDQFYEFASKGWEKYSDIILKVWNYSIDFGKNLYTKIKH